MTDCDQPDDRAADSAELGKLSEMIRALDFHGIVMLSKPCPKCNRLHHWRMITTMPPGEGHVQEILRYSADLMDEVLPEPFVVLSTGGGPQ